VEEDKINLIEKKKRQKMKQSTGMANRLVSGQQAEETFSFKKIPATFARLLQVLYLVWSTNRGLTIALGLLNLLQGVTPAFSISITALVIDRIVQAIRFQTPSLIWWPVGLQVGIMLLSSLLSTCSGLVQQILQEQVSNRVQLEILKKASTLDLAFFENPESYDKMRQAANQSLYQPTVLIAQTFGLGQALITLTSLLFLLLHLAWWLALIALLVPLPAFFFNTSLRVARLSTGAPPVS
jgi:ATP-binding cassette, subfamily B, bacterial